ncbi:flavin reductase family protein [bacterium SCSIO 12741]|nr:flavin reductase family protein [bacterium SCSIO 12741]
MLSVDPQEIPVPQLHGYLLGAVGPRPIAFASTVDANGNPNLSPFSFFNVFSANPPIAIFSPARRGRDNTTKHTYENVKVHPEVVINVVTYDMVQQMSLSSTEYPDGVNEFEKAGFTMLESDIVKPFRVKESPVQLECKVNEVIELGSNGGAGNLVISEVVRIHIHPDVLDEAGKVDTRKMDLVGRMGGNWYCRANGDALFEVAKPLTTLGIGVDQIPEDIRNSKFLTGNDLGMLGNVENLPDETTVNEFKLIELSDLFMEHEDEPTRLEEELHKHAHQLLNNNQVEDAWKTLLSFNNQD